jgi:predicted nucleotidyltransferase component of viral defense system
MTLSREQIEEQAGKLGFQVTSLEKVLRLISLLDAFSAHPTLKNALALKGGTALNLFVFDLPRLSVDIDLNYVGESDLAKMQADRPNIEADITLLAKRLGLRVQAPKMAHALTSWSLGYVGVLGNQDSLKIEVNYLYRVPLFDLARRDSPSSLPVQATNVLIMNDYELVAGKLAALIARRTSRDLYDTHLLLTTHVWNEALLRLAFVLYGGMNIEDWRTVRVDDIDKAVDRLEPDVLPLLRAPAAQAFQDSGMKNSLLSETKQALGIVLPLNPHEQAFLEALARHGEIRPDLLGIEGQMADSVLQHPGLRWKALNVQKLNKSKTTTS